MKFLSFLFFSFGLNALTFWLLDEYIFLENFQLTGGWKGYLLAAFIFAGVSFIGKPILSLLSFPLKWLTFGLTYWAINGVLLWVLSQTLVFLDFPGIQLYISGWVTYLLAGVILGILNYIFDILR